MKRLSDFICIVCSIFLVVVSQSLSASNELILGIHPYKSAKVLQKAFLPLAHYIGRATGKKVSIVIASDYQQHIRDVGEGN